MKKIFSAFLLAALLTLTGCFNVTDEITLNEKGGGQYKTTMDASKMIEMMEMMRTLMPDSLKDSPEMNNMNNLGDSLLKAWPALENLSGISRINRAMIAASVYEISFQFADISALNRALAARSQKSVNAEGGKTAFYSFEKGKLVCTNTMEAAGLGDAMKEIKNEMAGDGGKEEDLSMAKSMLGEMTYTIIYNLPGKVTTFSNKDAVLSGDNKTLTLKVDLLDDKTTEKSLHNEIRFR